MSALQPGQRAIIGPTGVGKTTLNNLLDVRFFMRLIVVRLNDLGVDIRKNERSDVRQMFGMVLQDTRLLNGTIRRELMYGNPKATGGRDGKPPKKRMLIILRSLPWAAMIWSCEAANISQGEKKLPTLPGRC